MKFFRETTQWEGSTPNHVYLLSDDKSKMYAYVPVGTKHVKEFKNPIRFDTRGRKFVAIENTFSYNIKSTKKNTNPTWQVQGSRGDTYQVEQTENGLACSCSGFRFRGQCRHIKQIEAQL